MKTGEPLEKRWTLRLPTALHLYLIEQAAKNGRSLNSEIVQRLLKSREQYLKLDR